MSNRFLKSIRKHYIISGLVLVLALIIAGVGFTLTRGGTPLQFVTVTKGSITETVSVTGNTVPLKAVSLGFGNSGTIAQVYADVGQHVYAGQLLATLNTSDLYAQVKQAQAALEVQQAKLAGLQAGSRPEDIEASQAALEKAQQDLANLYSSISDISQDSYAKANDATRTQLDAFFSNSESNTPRLTYITSDSQSRTDAETNRFRVTGALNTWQPLVSFVNSSTDAGTLETLLKNELGYLSSVRDLLTAASRTLDGQAGLSATTLATYRINVATAISEVNTASKNLNTVAQSIASQKLLVNQLKAQLNLKKAGTSAQDVDAQEAQIKSAEASVQSAQAKVVNSQIVSPITGVITQFDAKIGQIATPNSPLISIISGSNFEVDAGIPETDIGKLAVGDKVSMTLDAFPGETFKGSIFYINPAETVTQGVVDYKVKISFDVADPRMKSGLTSNLDIATRHVDNVLVLPQSAVLQNDQGTFVQIVSGKTKKDIPITLGIQDQKGMVEVKSGVTEGEQVVNIGLK